jgi:hypothetical protein
MSPLLTAVELCIHQKLDTPALVLMYSSIDIAAWVHSDRRYTNQTEFKEWVNKYLLAANPLPCSAEDLYSARCGLLHNLSSDSQMTDRQRARPIWYAWKPAPLAPLQKLAAFPNAPNPIAMYGDDLFEAICLGLSGLEKELNRADPGNSGHVSWQTQALSKAGLILEYAPHKT